MKTSQLTHVLAGVTALGKSATTTSQRCPKRGFGAWVLAVVCGWTSASLAAPYTFMSVSGTNVPGNGTAVSTFSSGNGTITVDHLSTTPNSLGNWGSQDNINSAIFPSKFNLFSTGNNVQGHLAQSMYGDPNPPPGSPGPVPNVTTVTFHLANYRGSVPNLIFGIWNTTTEVGSPVYNMQLLNASSQIVSPSTVTVYGNDDNTGTAGVLGLHQMLFTASSGDISFSNAVLNPGGIHTDALFLTNIPQGTQDIIMTATLPALNSLGDGVGYYFAETPEPSTFALAGAAGLGLGYYRLRRRFRAAGRIST